MNSLGEVLTIMCAVIVVGCPLGGGIAHLVQRRRAKQVHAEFRLPTDAELTIGLRELAQAVRREQDRDTHRGGWR